MLYFWLIVLILLNSVWLALVPFLLPGIWLIVITTSLFAWWRGEDGIFSLYTLLAIAVLALVGEMLEFFGAMSGAKKAGADFRSSLGAILGAGTGAVLGTFIIPIPFFGTLLGACIGAGLGACTLGLTGGCCMRDSFHLGFGAGMGQFLGITAKLVIGGLIWLIVAIAAFWP